MKINVYSQGLDMNIAKRYFIVLGVFLGLFFSLPVFGEVGSRDGYKLVFSDEFDSEDGLDLKSWGFEEGFIRNEELQYYQRGNAFLEDGKLVIEGRRERVKNARYVEGGNWWGNRREFGEYTSACVKSKGLRQWRFGSFEFRARFSSESGMWPAIWFMGEFDKWPERGEVDLLEFMRIDGEPKMLANAYWGNGDGRGKLSDSVGKPLSEFKAKDAEWDKKFHIYRMDWDEKFMKLYIDDELINEIDLSKTRRVDGSNPYHQPHYILMNLAIGSYAGDPGDTEFPRRFEIDYVRVYQKPEDIQPERMLYGASEIVPGALWSDDRGEHINAHGGGVLEHEGKYYWFGEHKVPWRKGNGAHVGVGCYSSSDLYSWKNEGIALKVVDEAGHDIERGCVLERPKVIYNKQSGKFVMWFHLELKGQGYSAARTGVAISDKVAGPYKYLRSYRPNAGVWPEGYSDRYKREFKPEDLEFSDNQDKTREIMRGVYLRRDYDGGQMSRDMTLFVDDDGKAYHICASEENFTLQISLLSDDYTSFSERYVRAFPGMSNEAPAICKNDGRYYLIASGCTGWAPNAARSAVSDSMFGPWEFTGNPCNGVNPFNRLGADKSFGGQSTYILPIAGRENAFVVMFDIWKPWNQSDSRYLWLPGSIVDGELRVDWKDSWKVDDAGVFGKMQSMSSGKEIVNRFAKGVHDPCIIKDGDYFYVFSTGRGVPIRRSKDLYNWEGVGRVFSENPGWVNDKMPGVNSFWAPDISYHDGKYYLYYSVSYFGKNRSCIGLVTNETLDADSLRYEWVDEGVVVESVASDNYNAIDGNVVKDVSGQRWLSFGSFWGGIQLLPLDGRSGKPIDGKNGILTIAKRTDAGGAIEAPFIVYHDGYYYQFVSFDICCRGVESTYKIMVGRSKDVAGPYVDKDGVMMVDGGGSLVLEGEGRWHGPGHNSFISDGGSDYLVYHSYDEELRGRSVLRVRELVWTQDGWPMVGAVVTGPVVK